MHLNKELYIKLFLKVFIYLILNALGPITDNMNNKSQILKIKYYHSKHFSF